MSTDQLSSGLVVARGAATALLFGAPAALANVTLAAQDPKPTGALNLTLVAMLVGFLLGGFLAGLEAGHDAARHGALAATAAFVLIQLIGILGRLDRGEPIRPASIIVFGLLAACVGAAGSQPGARRRANKELRAERIATETERHRLRRAEQDAADAAEGLDPS